MNKEIIEFPYETTREFIRKDKPIGDFKIHYYYYEKYLEKDVYRCYSNKRENNTAIGYIFSVERLHSNNVVMSNEANQKYFEAYMDAAREVFFNSEKYFIESYFSELNLNEESDKVRIDEILKYKAFLKYNNDKFISEDMFEQFKSKFDFPLAIFIEDVSDAKRNQFNSDHMKVLMMLEHHFFPIQDTNEFYASEKYKELNNFIIDPVYIDQDAVENGLKTLVIKSISVSEAIDDDSLRFMTDILPELYYQSFNTEYIKFSVLYQYIEIFINFLAHKMLEKTMDNREDKNLVILKSKINEILSEKYRIKKLFTTHSLVLQQIDKQKFQNIYISILKNTGLFDEALDSEVASPETYSQLYRLRNILYHNLRVFGDKTALDDELKKLNIEFEIIIARILTTFSIDGNETKSSITKDDK